MTLARREPDREPAQGADRDRDLDLGREAASETALEATREPDRSREPDRVREIELDLLLSAIYARYHYDFHGYARASLRRRLQQALVRLHCETLSRLQERILYDPASFATLLGYLTVPVSEMFRDPPFFRALREQVVPYLATFPSLRIWIAGCSTGEEVYSVAILLQEEGLLDRTIIYATDVNPESLSRAERGVFARDRVAGFSEDYRRAGGKKSLSSYYVAGYDGVVMSAALRKSVVFSDHSLATDSVFAETQLVLCRNVLIYFGRTLQDRALGLFSESLCRGGFLGLGSHETLRSTAQESSFSEFARDEKIYRRR